MGQASRPRYVNNNILKITVPQPCRDVALREIPRYPRNLAPVFLHDRLELQCLGNAGETKHVFRLLPCGSMELGLTFTCVGVSVQSGVHTYRLVQTGVLKHASNGICSFWKGFEQRLHGAW
jgi:hypothetical protein